MEFCYATLNSDGLCVGISSLNKEVDNPNMVKIESYDPDYLNKKHADGVWSMEKYVEDHAAIELSRMEKLEASQADQDNLIMEMLLGGMEL